MGMGFETCVSGLNGCAKALEVTSNNIANSNTVGFKTAQTQFADVFAASRAAGMSSSQTAGLGTSTPVIKQSFVQGTLRQSDHPLDMAINGNGFFRLANEMGTVSYTRNGQFQLEGVPFPAGTTATAQQLRDQPMQIVNGSGLHLMGYPADYTTNALGTINATGAPQNIVLDTRMPGAETTQIAMGLNLNGGAELPAVTPFDPANPQSFNYITPVNAYYAGGTPHDLKLAFVRTAPQSANTWDMHALDSGRTVGGVDLGAATLPIAIAAADQSFDIAINGGTASTATLAASSYGSLEALVEGVQAAIDAAIGQGKATAALDADNHLVVTSTSFGTSSAVAITGGAGYFGTVTATAGQDVVSALAFDTSGNLDPASQTHTLAFGTGTPITLNLIGSTQYAGESNVNARQQNGHAPGQLVGLSVDSKGVVQANFTNGLSRKAAQLVLANFNNSDGLINLGDNQWIRSLASGPEILDTPGNRGGATSMGLGLIQGNAVEEANVDLNEELVNLIVMQRHYQANAQGIKTRDQMLQTLSNIR
jgi:flagellar hook protein FlgE